MRWGIISHSHICIQQCRWSFKVDCPLNRIKLQRFPGSSSTIYSRNKNGIRNYHFPLSKPFIGSTSSIRIFSCSNHHASSEPTYQHFKTVKIALFSSSYQTKRHKSERNKTSTERKPISKWNRRVHQIFLWEDPIQFRRLIKCQSTVNKNQIEPAEIKLQYLLATGARHAPKSKRLPPESGIRKGSGKRANGGNASWHSHGGWRRAKQLDLGEDFMVTARDWGFLFCIWRERDRVSLVLASPNFSRSFSRENPLGNLTGCNKHRIRQSRTDS